ncbi:type ISP restriction/modification enzyme [Candidatus Viridilinea mediisalina]|uniref:site-specific DNA-methyltransferase (adenine-specific) n=1 Tax=Candidatus Viridilinea mediisalina TaxID=2024553 RepID=A0A2A6RJS7_9CHLR|nr:type ISP restriction/modification enzyme [Candidatus Viridilinea mediisalina]PDW03146.1 DNA methyltransferase [Candidatus Viridilinea mediisalina]
MTTPQTSSFHQALMAYAAELTALYGLLPKAHPEDQLKGPISRVIAAAGAALSIAPVQVLSEVQVADVGGRPDLGVVLDGLLVGYVELKAPGKGAEPTRFKGDDRAQWEKFKNLPNLIYCDGNEWALYANGAPVGGLVRMSGAVTSAGAAAVTMRDAVQLLELLRTFLRWEPVAPTTPRALAELLAPLCRLLREDVRVALQKGDSALANLAKDWRVFFFPEADDQQFADAYAQTFSYALLLARVSGAQELTTSNAVSALRPGHRLLSDTLRMLADADARAELEVPVRLLERVVAAVDPRLFRPQSGDPWLYFYEDFLAAYDPKMRKDRGVYYTPLEVVRCQVRLVAQLLAERFAKPFAFVDEGVVTLDPATGTGTYLLAALQYGLDQIVAVKGRGKRASAATTAAEQMHAFELLVGPYAVAHLRLTQQILAEGGTLPADGIHVYLTDTLESPHAKPKDYLPLPYKQFGIEQQRAQTIKRDTPVLVCLGNPPYDRQVIDAATVGQRRKGGWVRFGDPSQDESVQPLLHDFLAPLEAAGTTLHAKSLYNDYVYFWRWALWKVCEQQTSGGIISFITASSYLRGPGFAGMRELLRRSFDEIWIIDLEGDHRGARKTENVFAIQTPVAIAVGLRTPQTTEDTPANVYYTCITGSRKEKLAALEAVNRFGDIPWRSCHNAWQAPFLPTFPTNYWSWPCLTDLFPWQTNGMQFKRSWPIGETPELLQRRWREFLALPPQQRGEALRETDARTVSRVVKSPALPDIELPALANLPADSPSQPIVRYAYRSFDRQWMIRDHRLCDRPRPALQAVYGKHQVYLTSLLTDVLGKGPGAVVTYLLPDLHHFRNRGGKDVIPLWRDAAATEANLPAGLLAVLEAAYGQPVSPERFLAYTYGILANPDYVERFWEELTIPGPRLPITKDGKLFNAMADLGAELIWLHTFGERYVPPGRSAGRVPYGTAQIEVAVPQSKEEYPTTYAYEPTKQELRVGKGRFSRVAPELWAFQVSGMPVLASWLSYRMRKRSGKRSSLLDELRPECWSFDDELLDLLWVLEHTLARLPLATALSEQICAGATFEASELPKPSARERQGPTPPSIATNHALPGMEDALAAEHDEVDDD